MLLGDLVDGLAIAYSDLPLELIEQSHLQRLVHERGGERELWFMRRDHRPTLPIWRSGRLEIAPWGRKGNGLTWQSTVDMGLWVGAEPVEVRANVGFDGGVWYRIRQGIRGLYAAGEVFLIVVPASYYYRTMTRKERMPSLIGEAI